METSGKIASSYPVCSAIIGASLLEKLNSITAPQDLESFPELLRRHGERFGLPGYLADLARLEWAYRQLGPVCSDLPPAAGPLSLNPTLQLLELSWRNLAPLLGHEPAHPASRPLPGQERVLLWRGPKTGRPRFKVATEADLVVLKMAVEGIDSVAAAKIGGWKVVQVEGLIRQAMEEGILLPPVSRLRREPGSFPIPPDTPEEFLSSPVFTLQWHITQTCDLNCKHCYDRSDRTSMPLEKGLTILHDLHRFCRDRRVWGQVSFSGGNPLLYPNFLELYQAAADLGFEVAILGNPAPRAKIEELLAIKEPAFFQVSMEGLAAHNDLIRGPGHFQRVLDFLKVLRELKVYSMVMLTLTRDNMAQVLPLAEILRDRVDIFTFNRLAMVGKGAALQSAPVDEYQSFLEAFAVAAETNPCLRLKDNLINIIRQRNKQELFGGCAGYGCGAAFNFLCALPDGEIHACRKFPSLLGNVYEQNLTELYYSERARQYRAGSLACRDCGIRPVCGGCMAVAHGFGLNVFRDRDPYCFMKLL